MLDFLAIPVALFPFVIFGLRVIDMSLDTIRVLSVIRGRRSLAWVLGFFQSALWVIAISSVLTNLGNLWNIIGYASGFATGNVMGMMIEERMAIGHMHMRIISSRRSNAIADALRKAGYAATELSGRGKDGTVGVIITSVRRRDVRHVEAEAERIDPEAFVSVGDVRPLHRGYWRA
jgi:uncharacterized protein YebE (UPF0316 family)